MFMYFSTNEHLVHLVYIPHSYDMKKGKSKEEKVVQVIKGNMFPPHLTTSK